MSLKRHFSCITWKRYLNLNRRRWFPLLVLVVTFTATIYVLKSVSPDQHQAYTAGFTVLFHGDQTTTRFINNGVQQLDDQNSAKGAVFSTLDISDTDNLNVLSDIKQYS